MLENSKIKLRSLELEDSEIVRAWRFDFDNYNYFYEFIPNSAIANEEWIKTAIKNKNEINFVIESITDKTPIGIISLIDIDYRNQKCEMGRVLIGNKSYRGKGLGKEIINLLLNYAFSHLNMQKIYCEVFEENTAAKNLYLKSGFVQEGIFINHIYKNGQFKNIIRLAKFRK